jgi:hypothetical protein
MDEAYRQDQRSYHVKGNGSRPITELGNNGSGQYSDR